MSETSSTQDDIARILRAIREQEADFADAFQRADNDLRLWERENVLDASMIRGKRVLDWECGGGAFIAHFVQMGVESATGIDSWMDEENLRRKLADLPRARFERISLRDFAADPGRAGSFDLIFANTVTEHLMDVARLFAVCHALLAEGGRLVINHDNYYQPMGSHDHGFLEYGPGGKIVSAGPRCWESRQKCETSRAHRRSVAERLWWTWDSSMDEELTPEDCRKCRYYKRSQPWAHLLYQSEFRQVFPQAAFTTGYANSSLNKITPFQLRQFLIEGGFDVEVWAPHLAPNKPPKQLLKPPFNFHLDDLRATTISVRCAKGTRPDAYSVEA